MFDYGNRDTFSRMSVPNSEFFNLLMTSIRSRVGSRAFSRVQVHRARLLGDARVIREVDRFWRAAARRSDSTMMTKPMMTKPTTSRPTRPTVTTPAAKVGGVEMGVRRKEVQMELGGRESVGVEME